MNTTTSCTNCGGMVVDGKQKYHHLKRCRAYTEEGKTHLVCKVCGYRSPSLGAHLRIHGLTVDDYRTRFGNVPLQLDSIIESRSESNKGKRVKPIAEKSSAKKCEKCGEMYDARRTSEHLESCIAARPDDWKLRDDYVLCPVCSKPFFMLTSHLSMVHGITPDKVGRNVLLVAYAVDRKRRATNLSRFGHEDSVSSPEIRKKIEATNMDKYGVRSVFSIPAIQDKIVRTNVEKYGVEHPMQNEEVFIRQRESANDGPTSPEIFLMRVLPNNVVFTT